MGAVVFRKEVGVLPSKLEKDTLYFVRNGAGFDLYLTDTTASTAHKLNATQAINNYNGIPETVWKEVQDEWVYQGVTTSLLNPTVAGKIYLKRIGNQVWLRFLNYSLNKSTLYKNVWTLPAGYGVMGNSDSSIMTLSQHIMLTDTSMGASYARFMLYGRGVVHYHSHYKNVNSAWITWLTDEPFPVEDLIPSASNVVTGENSNAIGD